MLASRPKLADTAEIVGQFLALLGIKRNDWLVAAQSETPRALCSDEHASTSATALSIRFLIRIATALHAHGAPAHRLEQALSECASHLQTQAQFFSSPTSLIIAIGPEGEQRTHLVRTHPGVLDLGRLVELDSLLFELAANPNDISSAHRRLDAILSAPDRDPEWLHVLCTSLAAGGAVCFFGGSLHELWMAALLGAGVGLLPRWIDRRPDRERVFEPAASFGAALGATLMSTYIANVEPTRVTLAALIALLPGLGLTVSMTELATRHLASGTARLAGVITVFLTMTFGVAIARKLTEALLPDDIIPLLAPSLSLPPWAIIVATLVSPPAFAVLFRARRKEYPAIFASAILGMSVARLSQEQFGPEFSSFLGALAVSVASNFYARQWGKPALAAILPGLLMLVPGSIGFRSLDFFMAHDVLTGMAMAFETVLLAICLVGGLLTGNVILSPRRAL